MDVKEEEKPIEAVEIGNEPLVKVDAKKVKKTGHKATETQLAGLRIGMEMMKKKREDKEALKKERVAAGIDKPYPESEKQKEKRVKWETLNKAATPILTQSDYTLIKELLTKSKTPPPVPVVAVPTVQAPIQPVQQPPPKILSGSDLLNKIFFNL